MSVRVENRTESKAQYIATARQIFVETTKFLTRLSSRYSRVLLDGIRDDADEIYDNCVKADSVYNSDAVRLALREEYFLKARAACDALGAKLGIAFEVMAENPSGAYTNMDGKCDYTPSDARAKLDSLNYRLGCLIADEHDMLSKLLTSLKKSAKEAGETTDGKTEG